MTPAHKALRLTYCNWVLSRHQTTLERFAYTDGTTFYLARGPLEHEDKRRAALGKCVWRMSNGKDGLHDDNVGPSLYAKSQGYPVKIWGFLANGRLEYWTLPKDVDDKGRYKTCNMTTVRYRDLISSKFESWRRSCFEDDEPCKLVQDHERCLWTEINLKALRDAGCPAIANYPKCSPDLNAIEGVWAKLKQRLEATEPQEMETRAEFLIRVRRAVNWLNERCHDDLLTLCTNQKTRAHEVVHLHEGGKSKW